MKKREFAMIIERDEIGYFVADVPELPGCMSQGKSIEAALENVKEAIELFLESKPPRRAKKSF